jgi:hypothetical protein
MRLIPSNCSAHSHDSHGLSDRATRNEASFRAILNQQHLVVMEVGLFAAYQGKLRPERPAGDMPWLHSSKSTGVTRIEKII